MKRSRRGLVWILLLVGLGWYASETVPVLGLLHTPTVVGTQGCVKLGELPGPEDMERDPATGLVFIASAQRRGGKGFRPREGAVYVYRPGQEGPPRRLEVEGRSDLRLHGLGLLAPQAGPHKLFLVNHLPDGEAVEIVRLEAGDPPRLVHERTVRDPLFVSLNDVAPIGGDAFYVTNDHRRGPGAGHVLEDFALLSQASVVVHDGKGARTVAAGLRYANGLLADPAASRLYVAETSARRLRVYQRRPDLGLDLIATHGLGTAPDNLTLGQDGALYVAAHPRTIDFLRHAKDGAHRSPSQVLRLRLDERGALVERAEIYGDTGDPISGSSVALPIEGALLIGGVFDPFLLRCPTP